MTKEEIKELWYGRYVESYPHEMLSLVNTVEAEVNPLTTIIEIGVKQCGTLRLWERTVPPGEGMVIGVDISSEEQITSYSGRSTEPIRLLPGHGDPNVVNFMESVPGSWVDWQNCTEDCFDAAKSERQVHFAIGDSTSQSVHDQIKSILGDRKADFIFHDGGHRDDTPQRDFDNIVLPFLRSGGLFALADTRCDGTLALWKNLPPNAREERIVTPERSRIVLWQRP